MFFQTVWKLSRLSGKFSDSRESNLRAFGKCRKNNLRTFGTNVANKFTHFVRKVFARKILPTGKLGLFRPLCHCPQHDLLARSGKGVEELILYHPTGPQPAGISQVGVQQGGLVSSKGGFTDNDVAFKGRHSTGQHPPFTNLVKNVTI